MSDLPSYEIDHGEADSKPVATALAQPAIATSDEIEAERQLEEGRTGALARMEAAPLARHQIDLEGLILAGLTAQGFGAVARIDQWHSGHTLGIFATLAGLGLSAWYWLSTRRPTMELVGLPIPADPAATSRSGPSDPEMRAAARRRRGDDIARIEMCASELDIARPRLRRAIRGAIIGSVCGWIAGCYGADGAPFLAGAAAAGVGVFAGWTSMAKAWPEQMLIQVFLGVIPGMALAMALLCGANIYVACAAPLALAGAGWFKRAKLLAWITA